MPIFERRAVEIVQGNLTLYLTYLTPSDLFANNFYVVEKLDPESSEGYQRILEPRRSRRLSRHLQEAHEEGYAHLPTTIFLATAAPVEYDRETALLRFDTAEVCPFSVVDGQHRIEGLRDAWNHDASLADFQLPTTIAVGLDDPHQMYHFYIVNTTQKPVDQALSQQITGRFTDMRRTQELPYLPHWYRAQIDVGADEKGLRIVELLNREPQSPLFDHVRMANDPRPPRGRLNQASLVNGLKEHVLSGTNPISNEQDIEIVCKVVLNYLIACKNAIAPDSRTGETVLWAGSGVWFLLLISKWVFSAVYASHRDFTATALQQVVSGALDEMDEEFQSIAYESWWRRGTGGAGALNRAHSRTIGNAFLAGLRRSQGGDIQV